MVDFERLLIKRYRLWDLYLHEHQAYLGRCYLALKYEGNIDPFREGSNEEWRELRDIIQNDLSVALDIKFQVDLLNYACLRNVWLRCHWHVIPRYQTLREFDGIEFVDENWGKNWSPYNKEFPVPESTLMKIRGAILSELR